MSGHPSPITAHWRIATTHAGATSDATSLYDGDVTVTSEDCWSAHVDVRSARVDRAMCINNY